MAQADVKQGPPFRGRATIRDIADLAGVSIATVSRVLNDRPDVAPETRETVMQVVREQGFSTNRGARGLSSGRTGMIGLTLPLVADAYFGPMLSGASEALYERDMRIVLATTFHEHDREVSLIERLMRGTTDGAILMLPEESSAELRLLQRQGFPFVVVDPREAPPDGIACVAAMHAAGAKLATEHLLELGHRRIGAIAGAPGWYATEERLIGFRAALAGA
ncbi:MAG: LacI family DNA-binding transcriptional regulator, partial [Gaiellaceae bacterium]